MKNYFVPLVALVAIAFFAFNLGKEDMPSLEIGAKAPGMDVKMKDVSGSMLSLKDIMKDNGLLVIFSCNTCPFVIGKEGSEGWEGRYNEIAAKARENKIGMILINSNEAKRDRGDSYEDMVQRAKENRYSMSYMLDKNHLMADAFGARTTPHVFLFNSEYELVYKGAIDDNNGNRDEVKTPWLKNALDNLSKGEKIDPDSSRPLGCSIKRIENSVE